MKSSQFFSFKVCVKQSGYDESLVFVIKQNKIVIDNLPMKKEVDGLIVVRCDRMIMQVGDNIAATEKQWNKKNKVF